MLRDVHDAVTQNLTAIVMQSRLPNHDPALIEELASEALEETRALLLKATPSQLDSGLPAALQRLADRFEREASVTVTTRIEPLRLGLTSEIVLLRVCQELLANVRKHAQASSVEVTLEAAGGSVSLAVVDDGRGIDEARTASTADARGLRGILERVQAVGGGHDEVPPPAEQPSQFFNCRPRPARRRRGHDRSHSRHRRRRPPRDPRRAREHARIRPRHLRRRHGGRRRGARRGDPAATRAMWSSQSLQAIPGTGGADATRQIRRAAHPPRVLILTTYDSPADVMQAVEAGASGYLLKAAQPREILAAVRAVARGERAMSPAVAQRLSQLQDSEQLTAREVQVLRLMRAGGTNASHRTELGIGAATVKTHVQHIFDKLGVRDRTSAVATGIDLGLLSA